MLAGALLASWLGGAVLLGGFLFLLTAGFPNSSSDPWYLPKITVTALAWPVLVPYALFRAVTGL